MTKFTDQLTGHQKDALIDAFMTAMYQQKSEIAMMQRHVLTTKGPFNSSLKIAIDHRKQRLAKIQQTFQDLTGNHIPDDLVI